MTQAIKNKMSYRNTGVTACLGNGNVGVADDLGRTLLAERLQVIDVVTDIPDGETQNFQTHLSQIRRGHLAHQPREAVTVGVMYEGRGWAGRGGEGAEGEKS